MTKTLAIAGAALLPLLLLVAWLGLYNVAADRGHPFWLEWFLRLGMTRSVTVHSRGIEVPADLEDINRINLGATHFQGGCAECHGSPGRPTNPIYDHMLPSPPDLAEQVNKWTPRELYWIVLHGLQYTGMPAWSAVKREDEIWSMVAFLLVLPEMDPDRYKEMVTGNDNAPEARTGRELAEKGTIPIARTACDRCHDTADAQPSSSLVPRLAGQSQEYLRRSIEEYQRGDRQSGFMQPAVAALSSQQTTELAVHYSGLTSGLAQRPQNSSDGTLSSVTVSDEAEVQAALIASGSERNFRIPACLSCHGSQSRDSYPSLMGQNAAYLAQQLRLFKSGGRQQTVWGEVMTAVASHLDEAQIDALALWFSKQDPQQTGAAQ